MILLPIFLQLIVRSHEGPDARDQHIDFSGMNNGLTIDHQVNSGKLITVFSAPDYPQFQVSTYCGSSFNITKHAVRITSSCQYFNVVFRGTVQ